jgi:diguanylate cyclase (GGDEF)-like protein
MIASLHDPANQIKDPLTGAYTRAFLQVRLREEIARAQRYEEPFSLLIIDLDYFKSINDAFGHPRGDQVLAHFARRLRSQLRNADMVFRYGGDEFVLLFPKTDKQQAIYVANRLLKHITAAPFPGVPPISITLSIGVSSYPMDGETADALFETADRYQAVAKRNGRNQVVGMRTGMLAESRLLVPERMIDREASLHAFLEFFEALEVQRRGIFLIDGPPRSGRTRFLDEIEKLGQMRNWVILSLHGRRGLRQRQYGVLFEASWQWDELPSPILDQDSFAHALREWLESRDISGILITIDDLPEVDHSTLEYLNGLFANPILEQQRIALVFAGELSAFHGPLADAPLRAQVTLGRLSPEGLRVWVRHSLHWEAPDHFLEWLYAQTSGWPGRVHQGLQSLVRSGNLTPQASDWKLEGEYRDYSLADRYFEPANGATDSLIIGTAGFVGRHAEIQAIKEMLWEQRLAAISGPPGIGKTWLAAQAAAEMAASFLDGVSYLVCAQLSSLELFAAALGEAVELRFSGPEPLAEQLQAALKSRRALIVLDEYQPQAEIDAFLLALLAHAPGVMILLTGISAPPLAAGRTLQMDGLPYPPPGDGNIERYPAVQMFVHNARRMAPGFSLSPADRPAVAEICRLVGGIPLAIELVTAWAPAMLPYEIAADLETQLRLHSPPGKQVEGPLDRLAMVIGFIWNMLSEPEQAVLRRLSVFPAEFSLESAHRVAGASPFFLDGLYAKSLIRRTPRGGYILQGVLRQVSARRLQALPEEAQAVTERLCRYALEAVASRLERLEGRGQERALAELALEMANIRLAWEWAAGHNCLDWMQAALPGLVRIFELHGWYAEGCLRIGAAIQAVESQPPPPAADAERLRIRLLAYQGLFYYYLEDYARAAACLRQAGADGPGSPGLDPEIRPEIRQIVQRIQTPQA